MYPGVTANTLPDKGARQSARPSGFSGRGHVQHVETFSAERATARTRHGEFHHAVDFSGRTVTHDPSRRIVNAPDSSPRHRRSGRPGKRRFLVHGSELTSIRNLAGGGLEIVGEDSMGETLGEIQHSAVGAPVQAIGTPAPGLFACDSQVRVESIEAPRRGLPVGAVHRSGPETTLPIALAVVEAARQACLFRHG